MEKAFINVIDPKYADDLLQRAYRRIGGSRGSIAYVHQSQSLNPEAMMAHLDLYMTLIYKESPLTRIQRELIGVVVSYHNKCDYCVTHHYEALKTQWSDAPEVEKIIEADVLSDEDKAIMNFAKIITLEPHSNSMSNIDELKKHGFNDRAILDIVLVIAYFAFVNRLVLGTGVQLEDESERNYKY